jgi:hypothetical protein
MFGINWIEDMLDLLGSIFTAAYLVSILTVVVRRAKELGALRWVAGFAGLWATILFAAVAAYVAGPTTPVPLNVVMFTLSLGLLTLSWLAPAFRRAVATTSFRTLIALNVWRLGGFFFLLLYLRGQLPTPFAPVAAIGDLITAAVALLLVFGLIRGAEPGTKSISAWNLFGLADLLTAIALAFLSIPGSPFQQFDAPPQGSAFASLPWLLVPATIVPVLIFIHLGIFLKLSGGHELLAELRNESPHQ